MRALNAKLFEGLNLSFIEVIIEQEIQEIFPYYILASVFGIF